MHFYSKTLQKPIVQIALPGIREPEVVSTRAYRDFLQYMVCEESLWHRGLPVGRLNVQYNETNVYLTASPCQLSPQYQPGTVISLS